MHEMSVATSLIEEILGNIRRLESSDGKEVMKVEEVTLEIGELAFISEMQLEFCYNLLAKEQEELRDSKLTILKVEAKVRCNGCGFKGGLDTLEEPADHRMVVSFACPECGGTLDIEQGRGMILKNISVQVED